MNCGDAGSGALSHGPFEAKYRRNTAGDRLELSSTAHDDRCWSTIERVVTGVEELVRTATHLEHGLTLGPLPLDAGDPREHDEVDVIAISEDQHVGDPRLDALVRFTDPAEGEASLALRDGDRAALGYYLDNDRVHVGDVESCLDEVFDAWARERAGGRDCLILAPTRDLVRELNLRAQASRDAAGASVGLSDGCQAHRGEVVISRRNDRRLGVSGTDWVKNGDRWIVTAVRAGGGLAVRHATSRLHATARG